MSPQLFETIPVNSLLARTANLHKDGWRLVQISATRLPETLELTYSFDKASELVNLRFEVSAPGARVPSISGIYWCAFLYENELHDLFDLQVEGMAVDFQGNFYKTAVKFPFGSTKVPSAKPAPAGSATQPPTPKA